MEQVADPLSRTGPMQVMGAIRRLAVATLVLVRGVVLCGACLVIALPAGAQRAPSVPAVAPTLTTPAGPTLAPPAGKQSPGKAASIDKPMQVSIVRLAEPGCEPDCAEWIAAQGRIDNSTLGEFRRVFARLGSRKLPILIDSAGGAVDPSLIIARMIRTRGLDVVVTKTNLKACEPSDVECRKLKAKGILLGRPEARISKCASSCAFILAGGVRRYVGMWTVVGLHEIKSVSTMRLVQRYYRLEPRWGEPARKTLVKEKTLQTLTHEQPTGEKTYERVTKFFAEMGVSAAIMPIMRSAPNSSIRWLRATELRTTGLATDLINGEQLLLRPAEPSTPVATGSATVPAIAANTGSNTGIVTNAAPARPAGTYAPLPPPAATSQVSALPGGPTATVAPIPSPMAMPSAQVGAVPIPASPITTSSIAPAIAPSRIRPAATAPVAAAPFQVKPARPVAKVAPKSKPKPKPTVARSTLADREERTLPPGFQ